jgi:hypothetical protein
MLFAEYGGSIVAALVVPQFYRANGADQMQTFSKKALEIVLDALGSVAMLITVGMLAILVGAFGALIGFIYARQHDFPASIQWRGGFVRPPGARVAWCQAVAPDHPTG